MQIHQSISRDSITNYITAYYDPYNRSSEDILISLSSVKPSPTTVTWLDKAIKEGCNWYRDWKGTGTITHWIAAHPEYRDQYRSLGEITENNITVDVQPAKSQFGAVISKSNKPKITTVKIQDCSPKDIQNVLLGRNTTVTPRIASQIKARYLMTRDLDIDLNTVRTLALSLYWLQGQLECKMVYMAVMSTVKEYIDKVKSHYGSGIVPIQVMELLNAYDGMSDGWKCECYSKV